MILGTCDNEKQENKKKFCTIEICWKSQNFGLENKKCEYKEINKNLSKVSS